MQSYQPWIPWIRNLHTTHKGYHVNSNERKRDVFKSLHVYCGAWQAQPFPSVIMSQPCYNICIEWCKTQSHYWMRWYSKSSPQDTCANTPLEVENATYTEILQEVRLNLLRSKAHDEWWCPFLNLDPWLGFSPSNKFLKSGYHEGKDSLSLYNSNFLKEIPVVRTSAWNFTFHTWKLWNFCVLHPSFDSHQKQKPFWNSKHASGQTTINS